MPRTYGGDAGDDGMQTQFSLSQAKICNADAVIALRRLESTRVRQRPLARVLLFMGQAPRSHLRSEFPMGFLCCKPPIDGRL